MQCSSIQWGWEVLLDLCPQALKDTANRLRISSIQATTAAGSG